MLNGDRYLIGNIVFDFLLPNDYESRRGNVLPNPDDGQASFMN